MNEQLAALVRRHDPDRFLTALFAPAGKRDDLLALYAFNHEIARAREVVSEPMLALIRLQWWREVLEGTSRRHEVATPLQDAIARGALRAADLLSVLQAREIEAEPAIGTRAAWRDYMLQGPGGLAVAAARLLGAPDPEAFRPFGAAYGVAGLLRSTQSLAHHQRCLVPVDLLQAHGLSPEAVIAEPRSAQVIAALGTLAEQGRAFLSAGPARVAGAARAAALPAVFARRDLARWPRIVLPRGLGDRLAVVTAGLRGRIR